MPKLPYLESLNRLKAAGTFQLLSLVNSLSTELKRALFEDIFSGNEAALANLYPPTKEYSSSDIAIMEMLELPVQTISDNTSILESIFNRALEDIYGTATEQVLDNVRSLYAQKRCGLSIRFVREKLLVEDRLDDLFRLQLARDLSEIDESGEFFDWEEQNLSAAPYLIPGYMSFFYNKEPRKSLYALLKLRKPLSPQWIDQFYFAVERTLYQLLYIKRDADTYKLVTDYIQDTGIIQIVDEYLQRSPKLIEILHDFETSQFIHLQEQMKRVTPRSLRNKIDDTIGTGN